MTTRSECLVCEAYLDDDGLCPWHGLTTKATGDLMGGYPDIFDQLVDTDPLELRDLARKNEARVDALCVLLYDLSGRSEIDEALDACREHMGEASVVLMDAAISRGREITRTGGERYLESRLDDPEYHRFHQAAATQIATSEEEGDDEAVPPPL